MKRTFAVLLIVSASLGSGRGADNPYRAPKIWDDAKLKDWALPLANGGPALKHVPEKDYYASPVDNLRTYPVYHPDREPAGYMDKLRNLEPEPLVEVGKARTKAEWIKAGESAFRELHQPALRTDSPELLAFVRDREAIKKSGAQLSKDGEIYGLRWVVEKRGRVRITENECMQCHTQIRSGGSHILAGPGNVFDNFPGFLPVVVSGISTLMGIPTNVVDPRRLPLAEYSVPWLPDDRHQSMERMAEGELDKLLGFTILGTFPRTEGSPFWITKMPDLRDLKNQKFIDATATHRIREPADVGRYAALVMYAYSGDHGKYRFKPEGSKLLYHLPDDVLYAMAEYLWSLEPIPNPNAKELSPALVARGREIFQEENCAKCHTGPSYGGEKLTLAKGYAVPKGHPAESFIMERSVGTDPGLALKTRKGTGLYKVPTLRGLWYRQLFGHSGWVNSLEDWFDPKRLEGDFKLTGWIGPEGSPRAVPGHTYGTDLPEEDRKALITFLLTL